MKKSIFAAAIAVLSVCVLASCGGKESKAKSLAEKTLKASMGDPGSLEIVEWSKVDSSFTSLDGDLDYLMAKERTEMFSNLSKEASIGGDYAYAAELSDSALAQAERAKEIAENFVSEFNGYTITLKCRANNAFGAKILNTVVFHFDKDMKECQIVENN